MSELEDFKKYISLLDPKVKQHVTEVCSSDFYQPFMLHIDVKTPEYFLPFLSRRAEEDEDNTVPRVTVSDTLLGCMIGYGQLEDDFYDGEDGIEINKIYFNHCLKPNTNLVGHQERSNEHWLVGYSKDTVRYKPVTIGSMFIDRINHKRGADEPTAMASIYIQLNDDDHDIQFNSKIKLRRGYYRAIINMSTWNESEIKVDEVTKEEYLEKKKLSVGLLSHSSTTVPLYHKWF